jgi:hypothetical protein
MKETIQTIEHLIYIIEQAYPYALMAFAAYIVFRFPRIIKRAINDKTNYG